MATTTTSRTPESSDEDDLNVLKGKCIIFQDKHRFEFDFRAHNVAADIIDKSQILATNIRQKLNLAVDNEGTNPFIYHIDNESDIKNFSRPIHNAQQFSQILKTHIKPMVTDDGSKNNNHNNNVKSTNKVYFVVKSGNAPNEQVSQWFIFFFCFFVAIEQCRVLLCILFVCLFFLIDLI